MKKPSKKTILLIPIILFLSILACNLSTGSGESPETAEPSAEIEGANETAAEMTELPPTTSPTSTLETGGGGSSGGSDDGEATQEPLPVGGDGQLLDPCLFGTWNVDNDSMAQYLTDSLNQGTEEEMFSTSEVSGILQMTFDESGEMSVASEDYMIVVVLNLTEDMQVEVDMELVAEGTATYQADGVKLSNYNRDITVSNSPQQAILEAVQNGESGFVLQIGPDYFLTEEISSGDEPSDATYSCSGDQLSLMLPDKEPLVFNRLEP